MASPVANAAEIAPMTKLPISPLAGRCPAGQRGCEGTSDLESPLPPVPRNRQRVVGKRGAVGRVDGGVAGGGGEQAADVVVWHVERNQHQARTAGRVGPGRQEG